MDGSAELLQLAHLLRISADAARDIASLRPRDAAVLMRLVEDAERIAREMEGLVEDAGDGVKDGA